MYHVGHYILVRFVLPESYVPDHLLWPSLSQLPQIWPYFPMNVFICFSMLTDTILVSCYPITVNRYSIHFKIVTVIYRYRHKALLSVYSLTLYISRLWLIYFATEVGTFHSPAPVIFLSSHHHLLSSCLFCSVLWVCFCFVIFNSFCLFYRFTYTWNNIIVVFPFLTYCTYHNTL